MNVLIAIYAKTEFPKNIALAIQEVFAAQGWNVSIEEIVPVKKLKEFEYDKLEFVQLKNSNCDVSSYDLIVIGSGIWSFSPSKVLLSYLKKLQNTKDKNFAVYVTCILSGNSLKKISNILTTQGAKVVETVSFRSFFENDKSKIKEAKLFADSLVKKLKP
ncbi:MAG: hypothetical protein Q7S92_05965 [Candidatus Diapherotrites archaeon]|nr:hypothetical protein [Candidatus Diapherotrites archaeon]